MSLNHFGYLAFLGAALALAGPQPAHAELGGTVSGVQTDRLRMAKRSNDVAMGSFTRHDLTRANDGMVREFTNARGQVFAITWSGPGKPDLRTLLGRYFGRFQAASGAGLRGRRTLRAPTQVSQSDLQIQTAGHMGWFRGVAFIPSLAPADFTPSALAQEP